jgi:drug/metabolite transporter (DMT)-like permease
MSRRSANFLLLFAGIIWGMGFIAQQTAMEDIGPMLFMSLRFLLAAAVVIPFAIWERRNDQKSELKLPPFSTSLRQAILIGLLFFSTMALQQVGLLITTVTSAGFLTALYVVIVPVMVLVLLRQKQHWIVWPGATTALCGIYLLGGGGFSGLNLGDILVILGAIIAAGHIVLMCYSVQRYGRPVQTAAIQFAVAGFTSVIGYFIFQIFPLTSATAGVPGKRISGAKADIVFEPVAAIEPILRAAPEILYAGIFAGGLAFTLMAIGQRYTREADAAILLSSEALFAALFAALLLGERLSISGYAGCVLIFTAILLVQLVPVRGVKLATDFN